MLLPQVSTPRKMSNESNATWQFQCLPPSSCVLCWQVALVCLDKQVLFAAFLIGAPTKFLISISLWAFEFRLCFTTCSPYNGPLLSFIPPRPQSSMHNHEHRTPSSLPATISLHRLLPLFFYVPASTDHLSPTLMRSLWRPCGSRECVGKPGNRSQGGTAITIISNPSE